MYGINSIRPIISSIEEPWPENRLAAMPQLLKNKRNSLRRCNYLSRDLHLVPLSLRGFQRHSTFLLYSSTILCLRQTSSPTSRHYLHSSQKSPAKRVRTYNCWNRNFLVTVPPNCQLLGFLISLGGW
ncbi:unnamed protein product [Tuber aestivum]|uniref:Uncharacterized protein n=1 Tax=Tuber aestivum TaxID=59557 RepID=A0A292Q9B4_9PEZI|nr:unnamed protein product [Tuber aestivum]